MMRTGLNQTREQDSIKERWMRIWLSVDDLAELPSWAQEIFFDDINTAINSRIAILRKLQKTA
jgi:hypothetical protein